MTKIQTHSKLLIMVTSKEVCGMVEKGKSETELSFSSSLIKGTDQTEG